MVGVPKRSDMVRAGHVCLGAPWMLPKEATWCPVCLGATSTVYISGASPILGLRWEMKSFPSVNFRYWEIEWTINMSR